MSQQPSTSRLPVALAAFFLVAAVGAFAATFYLYDGATVVAELVASTLPVRTETPSATASATADPARLVLPSGMSRDFALRLWQEQVDSQEMIGRLVTGEVRSMRIDRVAREGDAEAQLFVTVRFKDGTQASGVIELRRYEQDWYVAGVSALNGEATASSTPLPDIENVDAGLLSTMIAEHRKSQKVLGEYLSGNVRQVDVQKITAGPKTATLAIEMLEGHGEGYANIVAIQSEVEGNPMWFLARFTKTGHNPPGL